MIGDEIEAIPDLPEPIRAWRAWGATRLPGLKTDDPWENFLTGPYRHSYLWPKRNGGTFTDRDFLTAKCLCATPHDDSPCDPKDVPFGSAGSGCGIYSSKTFGDLAHDFGDPCWHLQSTFDATAYHPFAFGRVLIWGNVYEHEFGYRSQFARPESLVWVKGSILPFEMAQGLADDYGIPLEVMEAAEARAAMGATSGDYHKRIMLKRPKPATHPLFSSFDFMEIVWTGVALAALTLRAVGSRAQDLLKEIQHGKDRKARKNGTPSGPGPHQDGAGPRAVP